MFIITLLSVIIAVIVCAKLADNKGRSVGGWIAGGFFLGWIGVIILCLLPDLHIKKHPARKSLYTLPTHTSLYTPPAHRTCIKYKCPGCGQMSDTVQCQICGYMNTNSSPTVTPIVREIKHTAPYQCPECGEMIDTIQCPWCGHRQDSK